MDAAEIKAGLDKINDQVREQGERALAEAKKGVEMASGQKERIDEMLVKQGELQAQMDAMEKKYGPGAAGGRSEQKSIGRQFVESEQFKAIAAGQRGAPANLSVKAITSATTANTDGNGGVTVFSQRLAGIQMLPDRPMTIRDLLAPGTTNSNQIEYIKETGFTNNAAIQATEGAPKAESTMQFGAATANVVTIAHFMKASKQILDDSPQLESIIDNRLRYGLEYAEEQEILFGSGASGHLNGVYTQATPYVAPAGVTVANQNYVDTLRLAMLQAALALFPVTGFVLNPTDWAQVELTKDAEGRYIFVSPANSAQPSLWGRTVVESLAMTVGQFLTGAFKQGAQIFDREQANVLLSSEDGNNFTTNMVTIRGEERLALAVYRPESFIKGALAAASGG
ncbi:phage major capsid protein [Caballeronia grimmiae]|uniref:Capsid protein n=1 Tax=Caballeronia grimmiae TaxID=1071679 RepID=A0A069P2C9_9BURK|nr:phage major capsid protein [Caballeronia grimmiae]KDR34723.1 capsid protein [Caballeronia grimmiae]GGD63393.1 phage capsid protein [Caballeronia grimmiae]